MISVVVQGRHRLLRIQSWWRCEVPLRWEWNYSVVQKSVTTKAAQNYRQVEEIYIFATKLSFCLVHLSFVF